MSCQLCKTKETTPGHEPWCQACSEINTWVRVNPGVARKVLHRISVERRLTPGPEAAKERA